MVVGSGLPRSKRPRTATRPLAPLTRKADLMKILLGMTWACGLLYVALSHSNPIASASQAIFHALTFYL